MSLKKVLILVAVSVVVLIIFSLLWAEVVNYVGQPIQF